MMGSKKWYMFLFLGVVRNLIAQVNLVPNPSFEYNTACPSWFSQISYAYPWAMPSMGTSDYFNSCTSGIMGVPLNTDGYQKARTGNAYAGGLMTSGFREYISSSLSSALVKDKYYCIEFYINLADSSFPMPSDSVSVGMYLSNDSVYNSTVGILPYTPQIFNPIIQNINDTINWTKISGLYQALGGESYITIGNFFADEFYFGGNYYYVEDVSVIECVDSFFIPNVFTPNNDGINDKFEIKDLPPNTTTQIFNRWGELVFTTNKSDRFWNGDALALSNIECVEGVYYYIISTKEKTDKGFVQLLR
jgi:gliding motility-associated-like protein